MLLEKKKTEIKFDKPKDTVELNKQPSVRDITGLFKTVSSVPTYTPRSIFEQIVLYKSGTTSRLYMYDSSNNSWIALTNTTVAKAGSAALEGDVTFTAGSGISLTQSGQDITITNLNP